MKLPRELATWKEKAEKLAKSHSAISGINRDVLRRTLVELNSLFLEAPGPIREAYRLLTESRIAASQKQQLTAMSGTLAWSLSGCGNDATIAERLGGQIRAVDAVLSSHASQWPFEASDWLDEAEKFYVIPRTGWQRRPADRQYYEKRGIVKHRIVPTEINGYCVEVIASQTLRRLTETDWERSMAACLFSGLEVRPPPPPLQGLDEKWFIIDGVSCDDPEATIDEQIEKTFSGGCFAAVWPELAVPPALRRRIQNSLQSVERIVDGRVGPEVVVAGTWHEPVGHQHVNRAYIYDGYGVERTTYDKVAPYSDDKWGKENILAGQCLRLLATEDALIGFAICLDFCSSGRTNPFSALDIDLMLVPSMGDDSTMRGHRDTAKAIKDNFGTRSFVVQQNIHTEMTDGRLGTILPLLRFPDKTALEKLGQNEVWKSYIWSF